MMPRPQTSEMLVVLLALAGIGVAGLRATWGRKALTISEYFLAGRSVGWLPLGSSLAVTTIWAIWSLSIAMPSSFGSVGWFIPGVVAIVGLLVLGVMFAPKYLAMEATTVPTILRNRYGRGVGFSIAVVSVLLTLGIRIPITIFVGCRLLGALWAWDPMSSALLLIVVPGLLVVAGGYRAVIATQAASGIAVAAGLLLMVVAQVPFPTSLVQGLLPAADTGWGIFLAGAIVVGLWYTCIDQFVVQRALAARSCKDVKGGTGLGALLALLGVAALASLSVDGRSTVTTAMNGNGIVSGIIGAAIIASGMATLSGHFMNVATLFTMDVVLVNRKKSDEGAMVLVGRLANTVVVFLAILTASSVALMGASSLDWMVHALCVVVPPIAAVTAIGLLWPRMHGRGAFWGLVAGWAVGAVAMGLSISGAGGILQGIAGTFACSALVFVGISLMSAPAGSRRPARNGMLEKGLGVGKS
jgi:solute:Na+ symporter, SSS family